MSLNAIGRTTNPCILEDQYSDIQRVWLLTTSEMGQTIPNSESPLNIQANLGAQIEKKNSVKIWMEEQCNEKLICLK